MMIVKRKKSKYIYLHSGLFKIMGGDGIFNGTGLGKFFVSKKNKGVRMRLFLSYLRIRGRNGISHCQS